MATNIKIDIYSIQKTQLEQKAKTVIQAKKDYAEAEAKLAEDTKFVESQAIIARGLMSTDPEHAMQLYDTIANQHKILAKIRQHQDNIRITISMMEESLAMGFEALEAAGPEGLLYECDPED
jgi:hypothetical protein